MEYISWAVFGVLGQILMSAVMTEMLSFQKPWKFIWVYSSVTGMFGIVRVLFSYYNITEWNWIVSTNVIVGIWITLSMSKEKKWISFLAFSLTLAGCMISEIVANHTYFLPKYDYYPYETGSEIYQTWMLVHYWIISRFLVYMWRRWRIEEATDFRGQFLLFVPMCLNMYLIIAGVFESYGEDHVINNNLVLHLFPGLIPMLLIGCIMRMQCRKESAEEELQGIEHQLRMERQYYRKIEESRENAARFRHDFNNYLTTARTLIENGEIEEGKRLLKKMENNIKKEKATPNKM